MARSWLQVTTGEVQSKADAAERLRERRESVAEQADRHLRNILRPTLQATAESAAGTYREEDGGDALHRLVVIEWPGGARLEVALDAFRPLLIVSAPDGERRVLNLRELEQTWLEGWLREVLEN